MTLKQKLSQLPNNPGCYIFKNSKNQIIYIGKAKELKKRVSSYFSNKNHDPKTKALVENIKDIDFIVTNNEVEALILENNLIKKYNPKYNIDLKDSKRYAYIEITKEDFPRILIARKKTESSDYFGPFVSGTNRDHIVYALKRGFKLRTCKKFPKKPCLRYHIGLCNAPCTDLISKKDYNEKIQAIKGILKGNTNLIIKKTKQKMKKNATEKNYEKAIEYREQLRALEDLKERQRMERNKTFNEDIINYIIKNNKVYLMLFNVYKGTLINKQEFVFDYNPDFFEEFLIQYYSDNIIPKEIITPNEINPSIKIFLEKKRKRNVILHQPKIGDKKNLLDLITKNIEIIFFGNLKKLEDLKKDLNLQETPNVIECFDISHLSGTSSVGSMIQLRNGEFDKSNYRKFKIKSFSGIDDTRSLAEIVYRRYYRIVKENLELPDLIVIDGGKAQLNFTVKELKKLGIKVPIISLAKKFEEIYTIDKSEPLKLSHKTNTIKILQKVRDEAHRFAISYNRLLRSKEIYKK
jgi:excinuclease ABC subunit C